MFKSKFVPVMLFSVLLTFALTLVSASPSPIRYYLKWLDVPLYYGLQNTQPNNPACTALPYTWTFTWTGTSDWSYDTDTTKSTVVHLNLRAGSGYPGDYGFTWILRDETTVVDIASGDFSIWLSDIDVYLVAEYQPTASASVDMTDTISFTLTCTSHPVGAYFFSIFYSGAAPFDSWIDVPEYEVVTPIPEFSLAMPVATSIAAMIYLAIRKRIEKRLE